MTYDSRDEAWSLSEKIMQFGTDRIVIERALRKAFAAGQASKVPDVDWLANVIRAVDGRHSLRAGALAEKIVEAMLAAARRRRQAAYFRRTPKS